MPLFSIPLFHRFILLLTLSIALPVLANDDLRFEASKQHFVGSEQCVSCHQTASDNHQQSDHFRAMEVATEQSVLADFNNTTFNYNGIITRFYKKDDAFWLNTDGVDGKLTDYQVQYTFGFDPLQQYLIELDGGRLQAFSVAWDTRSKEQGGQRWYHLYPDENIDFNDALHWTGLNQNWNFQCASCHSTHLEKNYNPLNRSFNTLWSEINVSCESCHGPASEHLSWATQQSDWETVINKGLTHSFDERDNVQWVLDETTASPIRNTALQSQKEIDTCGRCHARAAIIKEDFAHGQPLLDTHHVSFLNQDRYYADGQIDDEVYVYGSFLQSKMYQKGVTCSDCHTPHTQQLRAQGNALCLSCHAADKFESEQHHFHPLQSTGASCVACHMPSKTYMGIDERHDHSLRIPRPDLSLTLDTPNACTQCHTDQSDQWAVDNVIKWYGDDFLDRPHYGDIIFNARNNMADSESQLSSLIQDGVVPNIAKATALSLMPNYSSQESAQMLALALFDDDPMVRLGVAQSLNNLAPSYRWSYGKQLLNDPVLAVRIEAARALVITKPQLQQQDIILLNAVLDEYIAAQLVNADRPESQVNLATLYSEQGDSEQGEIDKAKQHFETAISLQNNFIPAYINYADMYRRLGDEQKSEAILRQALIVMPNNATIIHSLGLTLIRQQRHNEALAMLAKSSQLAPLNARYTYIYAVALNSFNLPDLAITTLKEGLRRHPTHRGLLDLLVLIYQQQGDLDSALISAKKLADLYPNDQQAQQRLQQIIAETN